MDLFLKGIPVENNKQTGEINKQREVELINLKFKMNEKQCSEYPYPCTC